MSLVHDITFFPGHKGEYTFTGVQWFVLEGAPKK